MSGLTGTAKLIIATSRLARYFPTRLALCCLLYDYFIFEPRLFLLPPNGHHIPGKRSHPRLRMLTRPSQRTPAPPLASSSSRPVRSSPLAGPALSRAPSAASRPSRDDGSDDDAIVRARSHSSLTRSFSDISPPPFPQSSSSSLPPIPRRPKSSDGDRTKDKSEYP